MKGNAMAKGLYLRRRFTNWAVLSMAVLNTLFGLIWLIWLLYTLFQQGMVHLNLSVFREITPPPGEAGGLANAIWGSLVLTGLGVAVGAPVGVLAGTFLAEFAHRSRVAPVIRFVNDILLSAPSIILGVFIYEVVVVPTGHFSAWAGGLALALIALPIIVRTTEDMLKLVPNGVREAAYALGAPRWKVIMAIVYRAARGGILTGVLLAVARITGETAPLLFTALNNQFWSKGLNEPIANLPVVIFQFAMSPYESWQHLAWAGALLITVSVLILNIVVRGLLRSPRRGQ